MPKLTILLIATALSACTASAPVTASVAKQPLDGGCVAMRRHFPMTYSRKGDTPETKAQIMDANAEFKGACP